MIHVDIDPMELGRILTEEISICMDVKKFLQLINDKLSRNQNRNIQIGGKRLIVGGRHIRKRCL